MAVSVRLPRSFRLRMTLVVVLLVLVATMTVTWVALVLAERDMKAIIGKQQFALLTSSAAQVDAQLDAKKLLLASLAEDVPPPAGADTAGMLAFVQRHPLARRQFRNLILYNRQGELLHTQGDGVASLPVSAAVQAFLRKAWDQGNTVVSNPYPSALTGAAAVVLIQPVKDGQGRTTMLLGGILDLVGSSLLEQVAGQRSGRTGYSFIFTTGGVVVQHPDRSLILTNLLGRPTPNRATQQALAGFEGWTEARGSDGVASIYCYKRLRAADWIVGARYPVAEAFAPMIAMRGQGMLAAAAFAVVAGIMAWLAIRGMLSPLNRLHRHIGDIRSGSADISVLQRGRPDEIGELSRAFHELMAEREAAQQAIRDSESLISSILERAPDAFVSCAADGAITNWNAAAERTFGWRRDEVLGRDIAELIVPPAMRSAHQAGMRAFGAGHMGRLIDSRVRISALHRDGHEVPVELSLGAVRHVGAFYATAFLHDVTERVAFEKRLTELARTDPLTGIANRLRFEEVLQHAVTRARRNREPLALAYLDIDHFKAINDGDGHAAGDEVLREVAARLLASVRAADTVARIAGDEFVIIFEQVGQPDEAARLAEKIGAAIRAPFTVAGAARLVTTSIGIALLDGDDLTPAALVARADAALYRAKQQGRDGHALAP
ncbi:diguanylate cyclase domain-containing protein [Duganella sp. Leaf126]|uniref:diguanylate cyclase domain-containing protein n=1 Tax=Duganella sp. Leaf126 TaxID=1736266 RepID=UPI000AFB84CF|nr:diguanylate cyclase [Duganella sp. Leaf126]